MWSIYHRHPSISNDPYRFLILILYLEYNILFKRKRHTSFYSFESFQRSAEWVFCLYYLIWDAGNVDSLAESPFSLAQCLWWVMHIHCGFDSSSGVLLNGGKVLFWLSVKIPTGANILRHCACCRILLVPMCIVTTLLGRTCFTDVLPPLLFLKKFSAFSSEGFPEAWEEKIYGNSWTRPGCFKVSVFAPFPTLSLNFFPI